LVKKFDILRKDLDQLKDKKIRLDY
jgi:hypothetical protein